MINVSETAATKINELLAEENKAGSGLRVFVQGGGCSGFQYGLMIEENGQGAGDQVYESHGVKLFVDPISVRYLKGAEVDFVDTVTGGGFTIKNPNATSTCGCGSSFSVDERSANRRPPVPTRWIVHFPTLALRPAGGKRSSKRDRILNIFLRQEGHLSADDLFDLVRREDPGIGRATVYRTLQWMVDAGIARKVDFGEGRSRFEPSYRHPRHFHLVCNTCHRSSEFLSSDVEAIVEEIAAARSFDADADGRADLRHLRGVPHRAVRRRPIDGATTELVFARDALRIAIATERSGLEFYTRAARA